jgi:hypothetical protein
MNLERISNSEQQKLSIFTQGAKNRRRFVITSLSISTISCLFLRSIWPLLIGEMLVWLSLKTYTWIQQSNSSLGPDKHWEDLS